MERHLSFASILRTAPEDISRKPEQPFVPAPEHMVRGQCLAMGGVVMALGAFGVASLEETSALSPYRYEHIFIRSMNNTSYFQDMILVILAHFGHLVANDMLPFQFSLEPAPLEPEFY